jgi:CO/xanthine dehydrogenase Mo-binding subunit
MDGGAAAIVQAIQNATGIEATEIPATPERLLHTKQESETAGAARKADR